LKMFYTPAQIPCYECPERCLIRSYDGRFLSSNGRGGVFTRTKARSDELWIIIKVGKHSLHTLFQSYTTGRYLCCQQESSKLRTCKSLDGATAWTVGFPDQKERVTISCFMDQYLCLVNNRLVCGSGTPYGWHLEIQTGELCFLYSPLYSQRIRCRPGGAVQLTSSPGAWYGWEVWRFVESGIQGQVYLTSWTHSSKVLKTDEDGIVTTTDDRHEPGTKWRVVPDHSSMMDHDGVILKSSMIMSFVPTASSWCANHKTSLNSALSGIMCGICMPHIVSDFTSRQIDGSFPSHQNYQVQSGVHPLQSSGK